MDRLDLIADEAARNVSNPVTLAVLDPRIHESTVAIHTITVQNIASNFAAAAGLQVASGRQNATVTILAIGARTCDITVNITERAVASLLNIVIADRVTIFG